MTEQGERREPVVTGLADIDPVGPLGLGLVVLVASVVGGLLTSGGLPWQFSPTAPGSTALTIGIFIVACVGWLLIGYGLLVVAAKVDAIFDMLRNRD